MTPTARTLRSRFLVNVVLGLACCAACSCASGGADASRAATAAVTFEERYGFRPDGVKLASAGYMVDFRFWVTDPELAWTVFGARDGGPFLTHLATGSTLIVPSPAYVGRLAPSEQPKANRRHFVFFANPGRLVEKGDEVVIRIGGVEIGPLVVE